MDELISTIVYLIPIAAVIFLRVFATNKKAQAAKAKKAETYRQLVERVRSTREKKETDSPLSRVSGREPEDGWQPHWIEEKDVPAEPERPSEPVEPLVTETPQLQDFPLSGDGPSLPSFADLSRAEVRVAASARAERPFPDSVERLSPLKKALVLSEILGKPKSLENGDQGF